VNNPQPTITSPLSPTELRRYARHLTLPQIGEEGQQRLKSGSVLLVGAGGLGSPAALYLAAAGVGRLGLVDFDRVDESNLHRQILYGTSDVGKPKLEAARTRLHDANPEITIATHELQLSSKNALEIVSQYDLVVDGTDNFPTRYLVNDACVLTGRPNVYGSVFRFEGQVSVFGAPGGPCYRCLYPEPPPPGLVPSCEEGGVLGVLPGVIGTLQATEALKLLTRTGEPLIGRLLLFDALKMEFRQLRLRKDENCKVCGAQPVVRELIDYENFCAGATRMPNDEAVITPEALYERLTKGEQLTVIDVREPREWAVGHIEGARHIPMAQLESQKGTLDPATEIILYCRSGGRSGRATEMLRRSGFSQARNMIGGIVRWAREVDPNVKVG